MGSSPGGGGGIGGGGVFPCATDMRPAQANKIEAIFVLFCIV